MKKICVVVGSRANYSSIKSVMSAIKAHKLLELQVVANASALLDKYGAVINLIENDGFYINHRLYTLVEGENPITMAKSTGLGLIDLSTAFDILKPDIVLTVGDRFETMSTVLAAAYMNIPIAHTMGGEVSGTIDESIRHAVTKFAHIHFPASQDAFNRIVKLGERPEDIFLVGCPRIDLVDKILKNLDKVNLDYINVMGVGDKIDLNKDFILVSQHPVTTEFGNDEENIFQTLKAVSNSDLQAIILWPNADAGSYDISKGMRKFRELNDKKFRYFKNLPIDIYVWLMSKTKCLVGNSSSGLREGAFIGTPVVNIGSRQNMRERGNNVVNSSNDTSNIIEALNNQLTHGKYPPNPIYGNGNAGVKISNILSECNPRIQKIITY